MTRRAIGARLVAGATCLAAGPALSAPPGPPPVRVDHHVHLNSPAIQAFLPQFCAATARFGKCDPAFTAQHTAGDLFGQMESAGVKRALVLSTAYLAESPLMATPPADPLRLVRAANDFTVGLAARFPSRIGAFIAVHPLSEAALPEIARWKGNAHVSGLKLHLTSAMVSLRDPAHLRRLAAVAGAAAEAGFAMVIHLRGPDPRYGAQDVRNFVAEVVPAARGAPIQVAHAGGWGGLDAATLDALGAFAEAFEADPGLARSIWFDLADVWRATSSKSDKEALVGLIRRIGPPRFVPGSDWPFCGDLKPYYAARYPDLPLDGAEWRMIRLNAPPYARAPGAWLRPV